MMFQKCDAVSYAVRNKEGCGGARGGRARLMRLSDGRERERERDLGISAFPPGVFSLHDFICKAIINFLNEISN